MKELMQILSLKRPSTLKGKLFVKASIKSTMGPSF